jgi:hypothetical protein
LQGDVRLSGLSRTGSMNDSLHRRGRTPDPGDGSMVAAKGCLPAFADSNKLYRTK